MQKCYLYVSQWCHMRRHSKVGIMCLVLLVILQNQPLFGEAPSEVKVLRLKKFQAAKNGL